MNRPCLATLSLAHDDEGFCEPMRGNYLTKEYFHLIPLMRIIALGFSESCNIDRVNGFMKSVKQSQLNEPHLLLCFVRNLSYIQMPDLVH